jgi:hypothetical protein
MVVVLQKRPLGVPTLNLPYRGHAGKRLVSYATHSAMAIPAAITTAPNLWVGLIGVTVAILMALRGISMALVAAIASFAT